MPACARNRRFSFSSAFHTNPSGQNFPSFLRSCFHPTSKKDARVRPTSQKKKKTASSTSNLRIPLHPWDLPHSPEASNLGARANEAIAALNRIVMSGTHVNTRCANKGNKINRKKNTSRRERNNNMDHQAWINMNSRELLETNDK